MSTDTEKFLAVSPKSAAEPRPRGRYQLSWKHEQFALKVAFGIVPNEAYAEVYGLDSTNPLQLHTLTTMSSKLMQDTTVRLRIRELHQPVIRKLQRKLEYNLQQAFEQCQTAYDLAMADGNVTALLRAIELQAKLGKLLSEEVNVTHRYGALDSADTDTLLEMRKMVEERRAKRKLLPLPAPVIIDLPHKEVRGDVHDA